MPRRDHNREYQYRLAHAAMKHKRDCLEALGTGIDHEITRLDVRSVLLAIENQKLRDAEPPAED